MAFSYRHAIGVDVAGGSIGQGEVIEVEQLAVVVGAGGRAQVQE